MNLSECDEMLSMQEEPAISLFPDIGRLEERLTEAYWRRVDEATGNNEEVAGAHPAS
jgi:hypothetical protein